MNGAAPLLRLHGYAVSNYFNIAHAALIEKRADFVLVRTRASRDPDFLAISPMGKIPVLETPQGWLSETVAILEYLEDTLGSPPLYPADAYLRGRARQIINIVQMYIEVPARSLFPGVFMGGSNSPATEEAARAMFDRAIAAIRRLVEPDPYLLGKHLSYADLFAFYCLDIAERLTGFIYARSILAEIGAESWFAQMHGRHSSMMAFGEFDREFPLYLIEKNAAYRLSEQPRSSLAPGSGPHLSA